MVALENLSQLTTKLELMRVRDATRERLLNVQC